MKSALCLVLLSSLICLPARAREIETGAIMLCDTQKQVDVAYVQGPRLGTTRSRSHAFGIIPG
jgi:hypothetical protein